MLPYTAAATRHYFFCPADPSSGFVFTPGGYAHGFATSSYVANGAIFVNTRRSLIQAMSEPSTTIIMSERLANCNCTYTAWADPAACVCKLPQLDQYGQPIQGSMLTGVTVQGDARDCTCTIYVPGQQNPPATIFQSGHPAKVNVLRGDGQVSCYSSRLRSRSPELPTCGHWPRLLGGSNSNRNRIALEMDHSQCHGQTRAGQS